MSDELSLRGSLIWNRFGGTGELHTQFSPCDSSIIQTAQLLSPEELASLLREMPPSPQISHEELARFTARLLAQLNTIRVHLREAMQHETGFISSDCDELLAGCLAYVQQFPAFLIDSESAEDTPIFYEAYGQARRIRLARAPWGTVAVILPQNAFLLVGLTVALGAVATGNRAILRAPLQSARSALLLAEAFARAGVPSDAVSVVLCKSKEFVAAVCDSPQPMLLHYMGSSGHAPAILKQCFEAGKGAIADGTGNVWVFADEGCDPRRVAAILASGATRYNGQTCTSINGALVHPVLYEAVRDALQENFASLKCGHPLTKNVAVGALFDAAQAAWCLEQIASSGGTIFGGACEGNYLAPAVVEKPDLDSALVREGLFGPVLWINPGTREDFVRLWPSNRYPLCAGVLSRENPDWWLQNLPNAARIVCNGDPSVEHIFEPWGGYAPSGANPVSVWHQKYTRVVSIDEAV